MKKFLFIAVMLLLSVSCTHVKADNNETHVQREGNTFIQTSSRGNRAEPVKTPYTWKDSKGNVYDVYMSSTGSCFVNKVSSKTGKEYRYYLGPEISEQICKELGIEYKGKKSTSENS